MRNFLVDYWANYAKCEALENWFKSCNLHLLDVYDMWNGL